MEKTPTLTTATACSSALTGVTVEQTEAHRRHNLLVVAVKAPDGTLKFNPRAAYAFGDGDIVMVMGHRDDIARFRDQFDI